MAESKNIVKSEFKRYQSKGYGAVVASAIIAVFVLTWRPLALMWWDWAQSVMQERGWNIQLFYAVFG